MVPGIGKEEASFSLHSSEELPTQENVLLSIDKFTERVENHSQKLLVRTLRVAMPSMKTLAKNKASEPRLEIVEEKILMMLMSGFLFDRPLLESFLL